MWYGQKILKIKNKKKYFKNLKINKQLRSWSYITCIKGNQEKTFKQKENLIPLWFHRLMYLEILKSGLPKTKDCLDPSFVWESWNPFFSSMCSVLLGQPFLLHSGLTYFDPSRNTNYSSLLFNPKEKENGLCHRYNEYKDDLSSWLFRSAPGRHSPVKHTAFHIIWGSRDRKSFPRKYVTISASGTAWEKSCFLS